MKRGERLTMTSEPARAEKFYAYQVLFSEKCRLCLRVRIQERTSGSWVSADLAERLVLNQVVRSGETFEMEVECTEDCVFSAALHGDHQGEPAS